jgi:hypothetical protein
MRLSMFRLPSRRREQRMANGFFSICSSPPAFSFVGSTRMLRRIARGNSFIRPTLIRAPIRARQTTRKAAMSKSAKRRSRRGFRHKRFMPNEEAAHREAAFAAIRRLYAELLPLWRFCRCGYCRRHKLCSGDVRPCLQRAWPLIPAKLQDEACRQVIAGGPRRIPPATHTEWQLPGFRRPISFTRTDFRTGDF